MNYQNRRSVTCKVGCIIFKNSCETYLLCLLAGSPSSPPLRDAWSSRPKKLAMDSTAPPVEAALSAQHIRHVMHLSQAGPVRHRPLPRPTLHNSPTRPPATAATTATRYPVCCRPSESRAMLSRQCRRAAPSSSRSSPVRHASRCGARAGARSTRATCSGRCMHSASSVAHRLGRTLPLPLILTLTLTLTRTLP